MSGIVLKHSEPSCLVSAIRKAAIGERWWDKRIVELIAESQQQKAATDQQQITERQREVLQLIMDGLTNKEIAWKTKTSETAVKASIQELFAKAGVRTRSQLVRIAIEKHANDWLKQRSS